MRLLAIAVCLMLIALLVGNASAQEVTRTASLSITLGTGTCADAKVHATVPSQYHTALKAGFGVWWDRKTYELCWLRQERSLVIVWEDGHAERLPAQAFEAGA